MKTIYFLFFLFLSSFFSTAQTVTVSGKCITNTITLNKISNFNGRAAYQGTGRVLGINGITVTVYWIGAPDNLWVIDYEGQPYFYNTCNTVLPPSTEDLTCSWIPVEGADCPGSTNLIVNGSGVQPNPLPVSLYGFTAQEEHQQVSLSWKTTSEVNNKGFEIQRSSDAVNWTKIGFVSGSLNSSLEQHYRFLDLTPLQGMNFYRVFQSDLDGKPTFSPVVNIEFFRDGYYALGNNPGNGLYRLNIRSSNGAKISVSDLTGRKLINKNVEAGIHQLDITNYAKGTYLLRMQIGSRVFIEKLVKQ